MELYTTAYFDGKSVGTRLWVDSCGVVCFLFFFCGPGDVLLANLKTPAC